MKLENYKEKVIKECSPIEISGVISALRVKKGDVLVFQIEVGRMTPSKVEQYVKKISEVLRTVLPKDCKLLLMPIHNGVRTEITVLQFDEI